MSKLKPWSETGVLICSRKYAVAPMLRVTNPPTDFNGTVWNGSAVEIAPSFLKSFMLDTKHNSRLESVITDLKRQTVNDELQLLTL